MDKIIIKNLEIFGNHGVYKEENILGQKFIVSASLNLDTRKPGITDSLEISVDYASVCHFINDYMKSHTFKLLEAAAEHLVLALFAHFDKLLGITLEIKKPWAPIGLPVDYVSVEISRKWHTSYIALGSNIGDKLGYLENAVSTIKNDVNCRLLKISDFIITKPYGPVEQDDFLNGCIMIQTLYNPNELLAFLQHIESDANRTREIHWGPRTLDLDILLYDNIILESDELVIPHPEMHKRDFVLKPLCQIAPNAVHPLYNSRIMDMADKNQQDN